MLYMWATEGLFPHSLLMCQVVALLKGGTTDSKRLENTCISYSSVALIKHH